MSVLNCSREKLNANSSSRSIVERFFLSVIVAIARKGPECTGQTEARKFILEPPHTTDAGF
jgi:hypothetical protein